MAGAQREADRHLIEAQLPRGWRESGESMGLVRLHPAHLGPPVMSLGEGVDQWWHMAHAGHTPLRSLKSCRFGGCMAPSTSGRWRSLWPVSEHTPDVLDPGAEPNCHRPAGLLG